MRNREGSAGRSEGRRGCTPRSRGRQAASTRSGPRAGCGRASRHAEGRRPAGDCSASTPSTQSHHRMTDAARPSSTNRGKRRRRVSVSACGVGSTTASPESTSRWSAACSCPRKPASALAMPTVAQSRVSGTPWTSRVASRTGCRWRTTGVGTGNDGRHWPSRSRTRPSRHSEPARTSDQANFTTNRPSTTALDD